MEKLYSPAWKSSVQPRKQRKYIHNAPIHVLGKQLSAHLSKSLRAEFKKRSARVAKGDKVKVLRGDFAGTSGIVLKIDAAKARVYIKEASRKKVSGAEAQAGLSPSNLMIIELETKDKKRMAALKRGKSAKVEEKKEPVKKE